MLSQGFCHADKQKTLKATLHEIAGDFLELDVFVTSRICCWRICLGTFPFLVSLVAEAEVAR